MATDVECTEDKLTLFVDVAVLAPATRRAVLAWLRDHDIDPTKIVLGAPVHRDATSASLTWREHTEDGSVRRRWRFSPHDHDHPWPRRFPEALNTPAQALDPVTPHSGRPGRTLLQAFGASNRLDRRAWCAASPPVLGSRAKRRLRRGRTAWGPPDNSSPPRA